MPHSCPRLVLLVDRDVDTPAALAAEGPSRGKPVPAAERGSDEVQHAATAVPDYLVVEEDLADGSGLRLFRRLRDANPNLAAVMVSRGPSIAHAVEAIRAGFLDYRATATDCE